MEELFHRFICSLHTKNTATVGSQDENTKMNSTPKMPALLFGLLFCTTFFIPFFLSRYWSKESVLQQHQQQHQQQQQNNLRVVVRLDDPSADDLIQPHPSDRIETNTIDVMFWWEGSKPTPPTLARIMHAAVKSAVIAGIPHPSLETSSAPIQFATVVVFSNSLPTDFFCEGSPALTFQHTIEQENTQLLTCKHVRVQTYAMHVLLQDHPKAIQNLYSKKALALLLPNDISDVMRYLLIYHYGGTYMDLDQMMLQPLPPQAPVLVQEREWSKKSCTQKKPKNNYCGIIGTSAISAACLDPTRSKDTVLSLFSGVMGNFPKRSTFAAHLVAEAFQSLGKSCFLGWGCLGPLLITRVVSRWCKENGRSPANILPNSMYLLQRAEWQTRSVLYDPTTWRETRVAVLDVDFHGKKHRESMVAGLVDRMLWWRVKVGVETDVRLLEDIDEKEYGVYQQELPLESLSRNVDASQHVAKLPWQK